MRVVRCRDEKLRIKFQSFDLDGDEVITLGGYGMLGLGPRVQMHLQLFDDAFSIINRALGVKTRVRAGGSGGTPQLYCSDRRDPKRFFPARAEWHMLLAPCLNAFPSYF